MNRKVIYISMLCMLVLSCSEKRYLTTFSDIKFSSSYRPIAPFRIDGFYMCEEELNDSTLPQSQKLLFYEDGSYGELLWHYKARQILNMSQEIDAKEAFVDIGGIYKVSNDTLFTTTYSRYYWMLVIVKKKYLINNNETLTMFEVEFPELTPRNHIVKSANSKYVFIPIHNKPSPNNHYFKKYKWMWDNEVDWQQYIKEWKLGDGSR